MHARLLILPLAVFDLARVQMPVVWLRTGRLTMHGTSLHAQQPIVSIRRVRVCGCLHLALFTCMHIARHCSRHFSTWRAHSCMWRLHPCMHPCIPCVSLFDAQPLYGVGPCRHHCSCVKSAGVYPALSCNYLYRCDACVCMMRLVISLFMAVHLSKTVRSTSKNSFFETSRATSCNYPCLNPFRIAALPDPAQPAHTLQRGCMVVTGGRLQCNFVTSSASFVLA